MVIFFFLRSENCWTYINFISYCHCISFILRPQIVQHKVVLHKRVSGAKNFKHQCNTWNIYEAKHETHLVPERKAPDGVEDVVSDQTPDVLLGLRLRIVTSVEDDDDILHGEARLAMVALGDVVV